MKEPIFKVTIYRNSLNSVVVSADDWAMNFTDNTKLSSLLKALKQLDEARLTRYGLDFGYPNNPKTHK